MKILLAYYSKDHNGAMRIMSKLIESAIEPYKDKITTILYEEEDNRVNFESKAPEHDILILAGHGFEWCVTGHYIQEQQAYESIYDVYNYNIVSGKIIWAFACESARMLGLKSTLAGNTYVGFVEPLVFFMDERLSYIALYPFLRFTEYLLQGEEVTTAYDKALEDGRTMAFSLLSKEPDEYTRLAVYTMLNNMRNFVILKGKYKVIPATSKDLTIPVLLMLLWGMTEKK